MMRNDTKIVRPIIRATFSNLVGFTISSNCGFNEMDDFSETQKSSWHILAP